MGLSQRDVGAGVAAGGSAFLAAVLFLLWNFVQGFDLRVSSILFLAMLVTSVVAFLVTAVVWRVVMPDEPNPLCGALAGAIAAVVSLFIFTALIGLMASVTEFFAGSLGGSISEFISFAAIIAVYGGLVTLPVIIPIGASVGYGYEWYLARGQS